MYSPCQNAASGVRTAHRQHSAQLGDEARRGARVGLV